MSSFPKREGNDLGVPPLDPRSVALRTPADRRAPGNGLGTPLPGNDLGALPPAVAFRTPADRPAPGNSLLKTRMGASSGVTLIELVCVSAVILVIAGIAMPVANTMVKRQKELELRQALREIRTAIDRFQADTERYPGMKAKLNTVNEDGYPEKMVWLYEGFDIGDAKGTKLKYLRRLPKDPITGKREWATRSSRDRPGSEFTDSINVFDVRTKSKATALDGTKYVDW